MSDAPHVRCVEPDCGDRTIHHFQGGDYGIEDIPELFLLGRLVTETDGEVRVSLRSDEIRELKVMADAYSFDFDTGLIELCIDLHRFAIERHEREFVFAQAV